MRTYVTHTDSYRDLRRELRSLLAAKKDSEAKDNGDVKLLLQNIAQSMSSCSVLLEEPEITKSALPVLAASMNDIFRDNKGRFLSLTLGLSSHIVGFDILQKYPSLVRDISAEALNQHRTDEGYEGLSAIFYFSHHSIGQHILVSTDLHTKISSAGLNRTIGAESSHSFSPLAWLVNTKVGITILSKIPDIVDKIREDTFNQPIVSNGIKYPPPAARLVQSEEGVRFLSHYNGLLHKINEATLNDVYDDTKNSMLFQLSCTTSGRQLLRQGLADKISIDGHDGKDGGGPSPLAYLVDAYINKSEDYLFDLFMDDNFINKIGDQSLHNCSQNLIDDTSITIPHALLYTERGLSLLSHNGKILEKISPDIFKNLYSEHILKFKDLLLKIKQGSVAKSKIISNLCEQFLSEPSLGSQSIFSDKKGASSNELENS